MLLCNSLAGPTLMLMPSLAQQAGWLAMGLSQMAVAGTAATCGFMLLTAMRRMPGNSNFSVRVEFTDLVEFYMYPMWYNLVMACFHAYNVLTLMTYIIQSGHTMDFLMLRLTGCAYGLEMFPTPGVICGTQLDSSTPFGETFVLSASLVFVALICVPFSLMRLEDNVLLQWLAIIGLTVIASIWVWVLVHQPLFPSPLPMATTAQGPLISTLLFNYGFVLALPSWANEKKPGVSAGVTFGLSLTYIVFVYTAIGIIGGMAFAPYFHTAETLFSKLNGTGSTLAQLAVISYPILQNYTTIPVLIIVLRYNLIKSGLLLEPVTSVAAVVLPWMISIPFYTGDGFALISKYGGICVSLVINFVVPLAVYILSRGREQMSE